MLTQIKTVPARVGRWDRVSLWVLPAPKYNRVANFKFALVNCTKAKKIKVLLYFITHHNPHLLYA